MIKVYKITQMNIGDAFEKVIKHQDQLKMKIQLKEMVDHLIESKLSLKNIF